MNRHFAFTLFELFLVIAIIGIILGLNMPNMRAKISQASLRSSSRKIQLLIDYALTYSALTNSAVYLYFDDTDSAVYLKQPGRKSALVRRARLAQGVKAVFEPKDISVYPDGQIDPFQCYISLAGRPAAIGLSSDGWLDIEQRRCREKSR